MNRVHYIAWSHSYLFENSNSFTESNNLTAPHISLPQHRHRIFQKHLPRHQGLTLVHFSAQPKRCVWDKGCIQGLFKGYIGGVRGC